MRNAYLLLALVLVGCQPSDTMQKAEYVPPYITYQVGPHRYYVREFPLADGTRCVAYMDVAITCQWPALQITPRVE